MKFRELILETLSTQKPRVTSQNKTKPKIRTCYITIPSSPPLFGLQTFGDFLAERSHNTAKKAWKFGILDVHSQCTVFENNLQDFCRYLE